MNRAVVTGLGLLSAVMVSAATPGPVVDRVVRDQDITESSGLQRGLADPSILWTHNDSGGDPELYAIDSRGRTEAVVKIKDAENEDWEALSGWTDPAGGRYLIVGDIGDNNAARDHIELVVIREPSLRDQKVSPLLHLHLTYPGGAVDAEALVTDPKTGRLMVVTKELLGAQMLAVPAQLWPGGRSASADEVLTGELELLGRTGVPLVTDGVGLPDGRFVLRDYASVNLFAALPTATPDPVIAQATVSLPEQKQGESLAASASGKELLAGSEGTSQPIYRVPVPPPDASPTGLAETPVVPDPEAQAGAEDGSGDGPVSWSRLAGAAGLLIALAGASRLARHRPGKKKRDD